VPKLTSVKKQTVLGNGQLHVVQLRVASREIPKTLCRFLYKYCVR